MKITNIIAFSQFVLLSIICCTIVLDEICPIAIKCIIFCQELCTILLATEFAGDEMNFMKFGGLVICLLGIFLHVYYKVKSKIFCHLL